MLKAKAAELYNLKNERNAYKFKITKNNLMAKMSKI